MEGRCSRTALAPWRWCCMIASAACSPASRTPFPQHLLPRVVRGGESFPCPLPEGLPQRFLSAARHTQPRHHLPVRGGRGAILVGGRGRRRRVQHRSGLLGGSQAPREEGWVNRCELVPRTFGRGGCGGFTPSGSQGVGGETQFMGYSPCPGPRCQARVMGANGSGLVERKQLSWVTNSLEGLLQG